MGGWGVQQGLEDAVVNLQRARGNVAGCLGGHLRSLAGTAERSVIMFFRTEGIVGTETAC